MLSLCPSDLGPSVGSLDSLSETLSVRVREDFQVLSLHLSSHAPKLCVQSRSAQSRCF